MRLTFLVPERQIRGPEVGCGAEPTAPPHCRPMGGARQADEGLDPDRARNVLACSRHGGPAEATRKHRPTWSLSAQVTTARAEDWAHWRWTTCSVALRGMCLSRVTVSGVLLSRSLFSRIWHWSWKLFFSPKANKTKMLQNRVSPAETLEPALTVEAALPWRLGASAGRTAVRPRTAEEAAGAEGWRSADETSFDGFDGFNGFSTECALAPASASPLTQSLLSQDPDPATLDHAHPAALAGRVEARPGMFPLAPVVMREPGC
ncbi:uncharacterized protein LOC105306013 isoform X2 [Pteropus vampyrus]|uniref:Uncharacterized protein LOC105306013 isoform X2 n=1 Tax=Pteropus vampyrus TaxID=132908 RepID=A0A6P6BXD6_PTEVA|nr:uncharacterized protein LOC105306013 isoform X2 [Pteropus vampyrus]